MRTIFISSVLVVTGALFAQVTYENVGTTKDIMTLMAIPASNALFDAASKEKPTDADWAEFRKHAVTLAEAGNLLMTPGRIATGQTQTKAKSKTAANPAAWNAAAKMMRDAGKLAVTAIEKKDLDLLGGDVGEKILTSCSSCHDKYMVK